MDCGDGSSSSPSAAEQLVVELELRKELEHERLLRGRAEAARRALALELAEERQARARLEEELERKCEEAARAGREMEEERRMLQIAELWREERVQIKLLEAEVAMEEKLRQMMMGATASDRQRQEGTEVEVKVNACKSQCRGQAKKEAENPHIRRGIRGHVEFPKAVKTVATTQHKSSGGGGGGWKGAMSSETNLECQRAQLRVLMRHKNVFGTSINFVT